MKNRLLQAMKSLPMLAEDKEKFVNEISNISTNGSGGGTSKYAPRYFKIDWNKADEDWKYILTNTTINDASSIVISMASSYKSSILEKNAYIITTYPFTQIYQEESYSFSYIPLYISQDVYKELNIDGKPGIQSFEDIINAINKIILSLLGISITLSMEGITEITEEEFYNFD